MRQWLILFTSLCGLLHAQTKDYRLVGTLRAEGSDLIPLELKFELDREGRLEGTSVTNFSARTEPSPGSSVRSTLKRNVFPSGRWRISSRARMQMNRSFVTCRCSTCRGRRKVPRPFMKDASWATSRTAHFVRRGRLSWPVRRCSSR